MMAQPDHRALPDLLGLPARLARKVFKVKPAQPVW